MGSEGDRLFCAILGKVNGFLRKECYSKAFRYMEALAMVEIDIDPATVLPFDLQWSHVALARSTLARLHLKYSRDKQTPLALLLSLLDVYEKFENASRPVSVVKEDPFSKIWIMKSIVLLVNVCKSLKDTRLFRKVFTRVIKHAYTISAFIPLHLDAIQFLLANGLKSEAIGIAIDGIERLNRIRDESTLLGQTLLSIVAVHISPQNTTEYEKLLEKVQNLIGKCFIDSEGDKGSTTCSRVLMLYLKSIAFVDDFDESDAHYCTEAVTFCKFMKSMHFNWIPSKALMSMILLQKSVQQWKLGNAKDSFRLFEGMLETCTFTALEQSNCSPAVLEFVHLLKRKAYGNIYKMHFVQSDFISTFTVLHDLVFRYSNQFNPREFMTAHLVCGFFEFVTAKNLTGHLQRSRYYAKKLIEEGNSLDILQGIVVISMIDRMSPEGEPSELYRVFEESLKDCEETLVSLGSSQMLGLLAIGYIVIGFADGRKEFIFRGVEYAKNQENPHVQGLGHAASSFSVRPKSKLTCQSRYEGFSNALALLGPVEDFLLSAKIMHSMRPFLSKASVVTRDEILSSFHQRAAELQVGIKDVLKEKKYVELAHWDIESL